MIKKSGSTVLLYTAIFVKCWGESISCALELYRTTEVMTSVNYAER